MSESKKLSDNLLVRHSLNYVKVNIFIWKFVFRSIGRVTTLASAGGGPVAKRLASKTGWFARKTTIVDAGTPRSVSIYCVGCGAGISAAGNSSAYSCNGCGRCYELRHCPECGTLVQIDRTLAGKPMKCLGCSKARFWYLWNRSLGYVHQLEAKPRGEIADQIPDADRRVVSGAIAASSGIPSLARGVGCRLVFETDSVKVMALTATLKSYQHVISIPYETVESLEFGGRGEVTTQKGGGFVGGGLGVDGALEGLAVATVLNAVTSRSKTVIDTTLSLTAGRIALNMLIRSDTPDQLKVRFTPVFVRIRSKKTQ